MKYFISIICLLVASLAYSQEESDKVNQNKDKIEQLNVRLDNLLNGGAESDSTDFKIEYLLKEIKAIRSEMKQLNASVESLNEKVAAGGNIAQKTSTSLDSNSFYVVLASERDEFLAKKLFNRITQKETATLMQNDKKTWYHVVLNQSMEMFGAIKLTEIKRAEGYKDAWWVTGRKLELP